MRHSKSQTWSIDAIIAVAIFTVVLLAFFYITSKGSDSKRATQLADEGSRIPEIFEKSDNQTLNFIEGNKIDDEKIQELSNTSYQALKSQLNIRNDFCIHFEDEKGNLIFINQTHNV
ncbi:hypothetical protein HYY72_00790, partial [Candidatus Woesearchaeota archaeon]|nr:hypothetical protein [Candidatus Woesearchaeota archaeon]